MLPKSNLDWLSVASLWLGALIMAVKAGQIPLVEGAPLWLTSNVWSYVPFGLITFYGGMVLWRIYNENTVVNHSKVQFINDDPDSSDTLDKKPKLIHHATKSPNPSVLPESIVKQYMVLKISSHTKIQEQQFLKPYVGKWMELELELASLENSRGKLEALLFYKEKQKQSSAFWAHFDEQWEDHFHQISAGDKVRFKGKIAISTHGRLSFEECELV